MPASCVTSFGSGDGSKMLRARDDAAQTVDGPGILRVDDRARCRSNRRSHPSTSPSMLARLPPALRGVLTGLTLGLNTLLLTLCMVPPALLKLLVPVDGVRRGCDHALTALASTWVAINNAWIAAVRPARWDVPGRREPAPARLVPGVEQPPELGRHPGAAAHLPRPHSVPEVLPEAGADLGAGDRAGLVGAGLPVHEARQGPGRAQQRPEDDARGLREVQAHSDLGHQLRRGHPLHAGQARAAERAPTATCSSPRSAASASRWRRWASSSRPCST